MNQVRAPPRGQLSACTLHPELLGTAHRLPVGRQVPGAPHLFSKGCGVLPGRTRQSEASRGDLPLGARASRPHLVPRQSAVASGAFLAFLILRGLPKAGRMPTLPPGTPPSSRQDRQFAW